MIPALMHSRRKRADVFIPVSGGRVRQQYIFCAGMYKRGGNNK